jgi:tRNA threonylcarbamoyladenosine biosynthesis protein TsaE
MQARDRGPGGGILASDFGAHGIISRMNVRLPTRPAPTTRTIESNAPDETTRLGERIGRMMRAGDVVLLRGDLGAGKTQLARGVAAGLGIVGPIPSPTFTLVNEYAGRNAAGEAVPLAHIDLYRLGDGGDLDSLGLDEYMSGAWAAVIEWPERAVDDGFIPATSLDIAITDAGDQARTLAVAAYGDASRLLRALGPGA